LNAGSTDAGSTDTVAVFYWFRPGTQPNNVIAEQQARSWPLRLE